jgi:hypothetical protein
MSSVSNQCTIFTAYSNANNERVHADDVNPFIIQTLSVQLAYRCFISTNITYNYTPQPHFKKAGNARAQVATSCLPSCNSR